MRTDHVHERSTLGMARASLWWHIKDLASDVRTARWLEMPVIPFFVNSAIVATFPVSFPLVAWIRRQHNRAECKRLEDQQPPPATGEEG